MNPSSVIAVMIFATLIMATQAHAQDYAIDKVSVAFDIGADGSVKQSNVFVFNESLSNTTLSYNLTDQAKNIAVSDDNGSIGYQIDHAGGNYLIVVPMNQPTRTLNISYVTSNTVFTSGSLSIFFTVLSLGKPVANMSVAASLPEGNEVYQNSYSPADANIGSDGKRIILSWNIQNVDSPVVFSIKYSEQGSTAAIIFIVIAFMVGIIVFVYLYFREHSREEFMKGFRDDEKKTIEYIRLQKTALQSDLQKQFHFSRAKATRIVAVLEEKKLIEKKKYGRTNKLTWIKK